MGNADCLLVVEDDPTIRRSLTRWIKQTSPLTVVEAETIRDGMELLKSSPVGAIVDIRLPDGDGLDLVQTIKEKSPNTSILVTTASEDAIYANRAHLLGVALARKPEIHANILVFLNSLAHNAGTGSRVDQALANLAAIAGLSRQQRRIVELMARGTKRPSSRARSASRRRRSARTCARSSAASASTTSTASRGRSCRSSTRTANRCTEPGPARAAGVGRVSRAGGAGTPPTGRARPACAAPRYDPPRGPPRGRLTCARAVARS